MSDLGTKGKVTSICVCVYMCIPCKLVLCDCIHVRTYTCTVHCKNVLF